MKGAKDMLLVADEPTAADLVERSEAETFTHFVDPHDALEAMRQHPWPVVLLSAETSDFAGLCLATRRLRPDSRILGLCRPGDEPATRQLLGEALDDYLIAPPTRRELAELHRLAATVGLISPSEGGLWTLTTQEITRLVEATASRKDVETCAASILSRRLGVDLAWVDYGQQPAGATILAKLNHDAPRALVSLGPIKLDVAGKALVADVATILPSLVAAGKRTESLHHLAITDHLTGAYNRRYFYHATDRILQEAAEKNFRATLLLYDIDDFKSYNDQFGHAVGDEILRETAGLMKRITRAHDIVARIGGDEFAVLFWDKDRPRAPGSRPPESAQALARRFLSAVSAHHFPSLGPQAAGKLTISGGLASFPTDGVSCRELLRRADMALKTVKLSGKGAIRIVGAD